MPSTSTNSASSALHLLVRQEPLDAAHWVKLLDRRARLLAPRLDEMTLTPLSRLMWWEQSVNLHAELASDFLTWRFDGIIGMPDWIEVDSDPHLRLTWMLTRDGEWVWCVIKLDSTQLWMKASERRVATVDIWPASPKLYADAGLNLRAIWRSTAVTVRGWLRRRQMALDVAAELVAEIDGEEALLSAHDVVQNLQGTSNP